MFTVEARKRLRDALVSVAQADARISAAALVGSSALGREDEWSDIDLALSIDADAERPAVIAEWTDRMYVEHAAVHHLDLPHGKTLYRVFLLADTLQVDLSFWPAAEFGAIGSDFRLLFGATTNERPAPVPAAVELIGMAWLYALHARSSVARGRVWQAEYMISGMRDHVLALACLRHDLPTVHGRGFDRLAPEVTAAVKPAVVRSLDISELKRAFAAVTEALLGEAEHADAALADRLAGPLRELAR
ncbi:MAG: nucleotidyltransferase domain-containing protein [Actinomycetota bacterium]|nr:nucleotidyltransferase domain-containing protein [Actinomycetota bacterium]